MNNNFYVYFHINPVKQEVFYVGIGCKKRSSSMRSRSNWWHSIVNKYGYNISIIEKYLTWEKACEKEKYYIKLIGRRDLGLGSLVNFTNGGEGTLGRKYSEKTKEKMSLAHIGIKFSEKRKKNLRNIRLANGGKTGMFGKTHTLETKKKMRGHIISEETRKKISHALLGKKVRQI